MQPSYPIICIKSPNGHVTITPIGQSTPQESQEIECNGWHIHYSPKPDAAAPLVYCAEPEAGLAQVQAREQTSYDLWVKFTGAITPQLYLGTEMQTLKFLGQQGYLALNWGNQVGASVLRLKESGTVTELEVEVRSSKLDYLSDYRHLLNDISEHITTLIFDYGTSTAVYHGQTSDHPSVAYLDYLFLRYLMDPSRLLRHFQVVVKAPHQLTHRQDIWVDVSQIRRVTSQAVTALLSHPEYLARSSNTSIRSIVPGLVPTHLLDDQVITTFDTPPNRFVKYFLTLVINRLRHLAHIFTGEANHLAIDCQRWQRILEVYARAHFLEEVGEMHLYPASSQVLLKQDGYRQLNGYYRRFLLTGRVAWEGFDDLIRTPNKNLATLYEYWCYFELLKTISNVLRSPFSQQDILQFNEEPPYDFRISLSQQGRSKAGVNDIWVYYNRYFSRKAGQSYSLPLHPDYALYVGNDLIIFDAKYRLHDLSQWYIRNSVEQVEEEHLVYQKGDLYKMHTYRDALRARAVFILYPGQQFRAYSIDGEIVKDPNQLPSHFAGVGAIPVNPQNTETLQLCLNQLLQNKS